MKLVRGRYNNVGRSKLALIDHIRGLEHVNNQMSITKNVAEKWQLQKMQKAHLKKINTLVPYLNSIGKLSEKEKNSILSLNLLTVRKLNIKYKITGGGR